MLMYVMLMTWVINPIRDGPFFGLLTDEGAKKSFLPKICYLYHTMMKRGRVKHYLKKIQKILESRDTLLDFC